MRFWLTFIIALILTSAAWALTDVAGPFGGNGNFYGGFSGRYPPLVGSVGNSGGSGPIAGALLLEDNTSILLLEDGTSELCLEGGC
jgi:hypothetical protein